MVVAPEDTHYMQQALRLAEQGLGVTAPNPSVGCVIVKNGQVIAAARTANGGRPHAEKEALAQVGREAMGATVYVTLEPCNVEGQSGKCTDALIKARVGRVVIAAEDPYLEERGAGIKELQAAGIVVDVGVCADEARYLNQGFFLTVEEKRPLVTLKLATTLDGRIAISSGKSKWITGETARQFGHVLRYQHDAIMVGVGTMLADDPSLTCRITGLRAYTPMRIILDSSLKVPEKCRAIKTAKTTPTFIYTTRDVHEDSKKPAKVVSIKPDASNHVDLKAVLADLVDKGVTRLLLEGGSTLAASFLKQDLIDRIVWIHAPKVIGGGGMEAISKVNTKFEKAALHHLWLFQQYEERKLGEDRAVFLVRR